MGKRRATSVESADGQQATTSVSITFLARRELADALVELAQKMHVPKSALLRRFIAEGLAREGVDLPPDLIQLVWGKPATPARPAPRKRGGRP